MTKNERWSLTFAAGFVGAIIFWIVIANTFGPRTVKQSVPLSAMPQSIRSTVCAWGNHPVSITRTTAGFDLYNVMCSDGIAVTIGW